MAQSGKNLILEDVTIAFRNFEGKEDTYNRAGDRNFAILLDEAQAEQMLRDGWNVKYLKPRDDDETGQPYIQVAVSYKAKPPKIGVVTSKGLNYYTEDMLNMLDWVDIEQCDVTLNPYEWAVNGKTGVKAYLQTMFIKILEDYLELKWTMIVEESRRQITSGETQKDDYIDAEFYEDQKQIGA